MEKRQETEKKQKLDSNTRKNTSKLQKWESFLSQQYRSLTMNLLNNFYVDKDKTDRIESIIIIDQIYKVFANKLLVNHYAHFLPRRIMGVNLYRYITCLVLQIVLHQLQTKFAKERLQSYFNTPISDVSNFSAISVVDTAECPGEEEELCDLVEKENSIVEKQNNEFHFAYDSSSDSEVDMAELHRYASSVGDIKIHIHWYVFLAFYLWVKTIY